ncbi:MAG: 5'-methylthioadenosine/S-adenosylhomocysteine nucleosidase [Verrucomicrobia bacterium]|nr:5'-methylthioadenosine/S-adenosylhomocysteine nucleosidase [Verrucomicrobiota bacterium]
MIALLCLAPMVCSAGGYDAAILVAFDDDVEDLKARFQPVGHPVRYAGREFHTVAAYGHKFLLAVTGAGLEQSAVTCDAALMKFGAERVISFGVAGALTDDISQGDLFIVNAAAQHDRGSYTTAGYTPRSGASFGLHKDEFLDAFEGHVASLAVRENLQPNRATLVSGNCFIADSTKRRQLADSFAADLVDMNTAGLLASCHALDIPLSVLRIVSDHAESGAPDVFRTFVEKRRDRIAAALSVAVEALEETCKQESKQIDVQ